MLNRPHGGKSEKRKTSYKSKAMVQVRDDKGSEQYDSGRNWDDM